MEAITTYLMPECNSRPTRSDLIRQQGANSFAVLTTKNTKTRQRLSAGYDPDPRWLSWVQWHPSSPT